MIWVVGVKCSVGFVCNIREVVKFCVENLVLKCLSRILLMFFVVILVFLIVLFVVLMIMFLIVWLLCFLKGKCVYLMIVVVMIVFLNCL